MCDVIEYGPNLGSEDQADLAKCLPRMSENILLCVSGAAVVVSVVGSSVKTGVLLLDIIKHFRLCSFSCIGTLIYSSVQISSGICLVSVYYI